MGEIEAALAEACKGFVEAVVVEGTLPDGVEANREERLAVDEDGSVLADGDDILLNGLVDEQEELLRAGVSADVRGLEHELVEIGFQ